jgi:NADPH2:quinone reductase
MFMRTVQATEFGGPEVLRPTDSPEPAPGPGELVIDVEVAEVLFLDTQLRAGWGREFFDVEPPFVPGVGVAGTVAALGAGVPERWLGRRVIAGTSRPGEYRGGGYAERAVAPAAVAHEIPGGLDAAHAIAALHDGVMGVSRLEKSALGAGDIALVTAAAGSIGTWLIPLLAARGATVIAAARGERKLALARDLGADVLADYGEDGWAARIDGEVDVVFDGAGGRIGADAFTLVRRGGRFFSYGSAAGSFPAIDDLADERGIEVIGIDDGFSAEDMHRAAGIALERLAEGTVVPVIGQTVPLEQAADAHAAIAERRVAGKTLLTP